MAITFLDTIGVGVPTPVANKLNDVRNQDYSDIATSYTAAVAAAIIPSLQSNVAAVGTTLSASITQLTADIVMIGSCSRNSNDCFQLRTWTAGQRNQIVINKSGSLASIWPPTGGFIGTSGVGTAYATNAAFSLGHLQSVEFVGVAAKEYWPHPKGQ